MEPTTMFIVGVAVAVLLTGTVTSAIFWRAHEIVIATQKVEGKVDELRFEWEEAHRRLASIDENVLTISLATPSREFEDV